MFAKKKYKLAFSLLEQSMVLAILSMIVASGAVYFKHVDEQEYKAETMRRVETIENALVAYYIEKSVNSSGAIQNAQFPCPAQINLPITHANFGKISGTCAGGSYSYGAVPVTSISLPNYYMFDAWGGRFSFVVEEGNIPDIGNDWNDTQLNSVLYHIISHGSNGYGSYDRMGARKISGSNSDEVNNMSDASDYSNISAKPHKDGFDDIVVSVTGREFLRKLAGNYLPNGAFCSLVDNISTSDTSCLMLQNKLKLLCIGDGISW